MINALDWVYAAAVAAVTVPTDDNWDFVLNPVHDYLAEELA